MIGKIRDLGSSISLLTPTVVEFGADENLECPESATSVVETMGDFPFMQAPSGGVGTTSFNKETQAYGSLMTMPWNWLLSSRAIVAMFHKHQGPLWFKSCRICQSVGLTLAIVEFAIALKNFDTLSQKGHARMCYGAMGIIVVLVGVLQPTRAFFSPHDPEEGELKTPFRKSQLLQLLSLQSSSALRFCHKIRRVFRLRVEQGAGFC